MSVTYNVLTQHARAYTYKAKERKRKINRMGFYLIASANNINAAINSAP